MMNLPMSNPLAEHLQRPRNQGQLPGTTGRAIVTKQSTGDGFRFALRIEGGLIVDARFAMFGNPVLRAVLSFLTECIKGQEVTTAAEIRLEDLIGTLQLPAAHQYCAILAIDAMLKAIQDHRGRGGYPYRTTVSPTGGEVQS